MSSIIRKVKESHMWERRGAFVAQRQDPASRITALPPPSKKNKKVADKKAKIVEKKQAKDIDDDDDDDSLLDEKRMEVEAEASRSKKSAKIVKRSFRDWNEKEAFVSERYHARRQVTKQARYMEELAVLPARQPQQKSWWTRTMTACMPSEG